MTPEEIVREKIAIEVIKTLKRRFENFPEGAENNRNAPFHEAFLHAFSYKLKNHVDDVPYFVSLSSWLHGLNTTLGQSFFEKVAHILCGGKKKEYTSKKLGNQDITKKQQELINKILKEYDTESRLPDAEKENKELFQYDDSDKVKAGDFSADVFFEKANKVIAIELKSVKPNSGEMRGEKRKILEGKAALFHLFKDKEIIFYFGFPFDPTAEKSNATGYDKDRFLKSIINAYKFCAKNDFLIASELWVFLSGREGTMNKILEIINRIATPEFEEKYNFLINSTEWGNKKYIEQLNEWYLYTEIDIISKRSTIEKKADERQIRILHNNMFDEDGGYDLDRVDEINKILK